MWRYREGYGRYGGGYTGGGGHCHVPRGWGGGEGGVPPGVGLEVEMYPDEDEDAGEMINKCVNYIVIDK